MKKFISLKSIPAYLPIVNIDTDMIIPKQFLKTIKRTGLGKNLFHEMRYDNDGNIIKDFILNKEPFNDSKILIAGNNFGCGSSREHAPWALLDFGITCVISSSYADIFYNNCFKNGVLPIQLQKDQIEELFQTIKDEILELSVDLQKRIITIGDKEVSFDVEDYLINRIIYGLDDVDITLKLKDKIFNFEKNRKETRPWIFINE